MRELEQYQPEKQKKGVQTGLISVIVTVYNIREYLPKAVDSILSSTYQNLEVLLIDDGSTDGSERICDEYAKRMGGCGLSIKETVEPTARATPDFWRQKAIT